MLGGPRGATVKRAYIYESGGRWYLRYAFKGSVLTYHIPHKEGERVYALLRQVIDEHGTLSYVSEMP